MVMMVNLSEEACRIGKWATVLGFENNIIPHDTELALQFRKGIACVESRK